MSITIVLAEDLNLVRQGFRAVLETEQEFSVVADTGDGAEALRLVGELQPNILLTDFVMRRMSGLELAREIRARHPQTRVVILGTQSSAWYLNEAMTAGALGYVVKSATAPDLFEALRRVNRGDRYVSPSLDGVDVAAVGGIAPESPADPYHILTAREREVLSLAAEGRTNAEVGAKLGISHRTVEVHRANLMRKLGLRSQTDLVRDALRRGILSPD